MPLRRRDALVLFLVAAALVWLGRARRAPLGPPPLALAAAPASRAPAPPFELPRVDGAAFASAIDGRGRVLVVNFWATWCAPCRDELPALAALHAALAAEGALVVAVSVDARSEAAARFAAARALPFPVLADPDEAVARRYGAFAYPTTVVVDRAGRVALRATGAFAWDAPAALTWLRALLSEPVPPHP
jgi:peroxiredoxin